MRLADGVEIVQATFWGRPLNMALYLGDEVALVDTGLVGTPAEFVLPYLASVGRQPTDLGLVIVSHAHADHYGGNEELLAASGGNAQFATHQRDQAWVEDPAGHARRVYQRYLDLGLMTPADIENTIEAAGYGVRVSYALEGGEVFDLGGAMELEMVFLPGHTAGNIAILERASGILFQGETAGGVAQYSADGKLMSTPFYEDVPTYLRTLAQLAGLDFKTFVPSHLPPMDRPHAQAFLRDSLDFTLRFEAEARARLRAGHGPLTAVEMWRSMDNLWQQYPADAGMYMLLETHLNGLVGRGQAQGTLIEGLTWAGDDRDEVADLAEDVRAAIAAMTV